MADGLFRLDERPTDVMVPDEPERERQPRLPRVTESGVHAGVGHGNDEVRIRRMLACEPGSECLAGGGDALAEDFRVWTREVDVLEDARGRIRERETAGRQTFAREPYDFARLDVALETGADQVESAGLRRDDGRSLADSQRKRADAVWIPRGENALAREHDDRVCPLHVEQRLGECRGDVRRLRAGDEVQDDFRVRRGREK